MVVLPLSGFDADPEINAVGQVLNTSSLWTPDTPNGTTGTVAALPVWSGGMNAGADVVGGTGTWGDVGIWDGDSVADLNWLVPEGSYVGQAVAINDFGRILATVSTGNIVDSPHLLTPTDLPYVSVGDAAVTEGTAAGAPPSR